MHINVSSLPEQALLNECIKGNKAAWDAFVVRYTRLVYTAIQRTLRRYKYDLIYDDIEDLHNDVFVLLMEDNYKKLRQYRGDSKVSTWIYTIAVNFTINYITRTKTHGLLDDLHPYTGETMLERLEKDRLSRLEDFERAEKLITLHELVGDLKPKDRLFYSYCFKNKLPPEEIAVIMNISTSTVYSKKNRIVEKLKKIAKKRKMLQGI